MKPMPINLDDVDGNHGFDSDANLPQGWATASIKQVCAFDVGFAFKSEEFTSEGIRLLRGENIEPGSLRWLDVRYWPKAKLDGFYNLLIEEGDLVLAMDRPIISSGLKLATAKAADLPCLLVQRMGRFRSAEPTILKYVYYNLQTASFRKHLVQGQTGTQLPHVSGKSILAYEFPLPPIVEQRRIVAAIETNLTRLDAGVANLERVRAKLKRYRAAVLKAACEGRLVPTEAELARAEGRTYEPADRLLARILQERRNRWEADQLAAFEAKGKKPTNDKWKEKYQEPELVDPSLLPQLPEGWTWTSARQIADVQGGIQKQPKRRPSVNSFPFLRVANVYRNRLELTEVHRIELFEGEIDKLRLERDDLLIVEGNGSPSEIGRMAIWDGSIPDCVHQNHIIRSRLFDGVNPKFVASYWNSPEGSSRVSEVSSSTSGLHTLSVSKVNALRLPLPPQAEQARIVAEVERRLSLIDDLETAASANLKRADRLRQSILKRAFEGKLVPQDPADEPAAALLERISGVGRQAVLFDDAPEVTMKGRRSRGSRRG